MILVTGATGTIGTDVVRLLVQAGARVRAMTRDPAKAKLDARVEVVRGDFDDAASVSAALKGVERLFLLAVGPRLGELEGRAVQAAREAGVRHVVKISTYGVQSPQIAIARWHLQGEQHVEGAGTPYTFMRPSGFMSNALGWVGSVKAAGAIFGMMGEARGAPIHPRDIAECSVKALLSDGHYGKTYVLTGPERLSMAEQAAVLSEAIGRTVKYVDVPEERFRQNMLGAGRPPPIVEGVIELQKWIRELGNGPLSTDVETLLGRKALSWADWCRENAGAFR